MLGQERDGDLLLSWTLTNDRSTHIGTYRYRDNRLTKYHRFDVKTNVVQATVNSDRNLLAYVVKTPSIDDETKCSSRQLHVYRPYVVKIDGTTTINLDLSLERSKQIMVKFLYKKQSLLAEKQVDKLLVLIHEECKSLKKKTIDKNALTFLFLFFSVRFQAYFNIKSNLTMWTKRR